MPNFRYKARDKFARLVSGDLFAENQEAAVKNLQEMGYTPIFIEESRAANTENILSRFQHVKLQEISTFTRQLYALQKAGLPLLSNLSAIAEQEKNKYFKAVIETITRDIRGGLSLSEALKKHNRVFNNIYISMIRAGEAGGFMAEVLERLSQLIDQDIDNRNRISAATRYPMIAFFVLCVGFAIVVTFVIPRFAAVYSQFNAALPLPTRILIGLNVAVQKFWFLFLLLGGGAIFGFLKFIKTKGGMRIWDNIRLKVPVFGPLVTMLVLSRFARVTAILMKSGVPILEVLDLGSRATGNVILSTAIDNIRESVKQGKGISEPMKVSGLFPSIVIQMVAAGEQTGKVDDLLLSVADYYDLESGYMIKNLTTYIEPIMIFVLAVMVLIMALGIFMPMWNLIKVFRPS